MGKTLAEYDDDYQGLDLNLIRESRENFQNHLNTPFADTDGSVPRVMVKVSLLGLILRQFDQLLEHVERSMADPRKIIYGPLSGVEDDDELFETMSLMMGSSPLRDEVKNSVLARLVNCELERRKSDIESMGSDLASRQESLDELLRFLRGDLDPKPKPKRQS